MYCTNCGKEISQDTKFCKFCGKRSDGDSAQMAAPQTSFQQPNSSGYGVASMGTRFINYILDRFFSYIFIVIVGALFSGLFSFDTQENSGGTFFLALLLLIGYYVFFEGVWQKTIGKFITRTKVVMRDGTRPDFLHTLGRSFARLIPFDALSFLFSPIGWHDSVSGTLVVPDSYTEADVKKIDLKNPSSKSATNAAPIVIVVIIVAIGIIGLLSTLAVVALNSARQRSRDAKRVADIRQIQTALELGFSETYSYPNGAYADGLDVYGSAVLGSANASVLCKVGKRPTWASSTSECRGGTVYMGLVPSNPAPNGIPYEYTGLPTSYQLLFSLEGATGQLSAGTNCANQNGITFGSSC